MIEKVKLTTPATIKLNNILKQCIDDMNEIGIAVDENKITQLAYFGKFNSRGCCIENKDGSYTVAVSKRCVEYVDNEKVIENIKAVFYHELLHTLPECANGYLGHGKNFVEYANQCDKKLNTHTKRHLDETLFFNPDMVPEEIYRCDKCGYEYYASKSIGYDFTCDFCEEMMHK